MCRYGDDIAMQEKEKKDMFILVGEGKKVERVHLEKSDFLTT